jgi:hypothetical protein
MKKKLLWKTFIEGFEDIQRVALYQRADGRFLIQNEHGRSIKFKDYDAAAAELGRSILGALANAGEISFKYDRREDDQ